MKFLKSKGVYFIIALMIGLTIINSIETKKYDENNKKIDESYISMNIN